MRLKKTVILVMVLVLAMTAAACGGSDDEGEDAPTVEQAEAVARDWFERVWTLTEPSELVDLLCEADREFVSEQDATEYVYTLNESDVTFDVQVDGDSATVSGDGTFVVQEGDGEPQTFDFDPEDTFVELVIEEGEWRVCGIGPGSEAGEDEDGAETPEPDDALDG